VLTHALLVVSTFLTIPQLLDDGATARSPQPAPADPRSAFERSALTIGQAASGARALLRDGVVLTDAETSALGAPKPSDGRAGFMGIYLPKLRRGLLIYAILVPSLTLGFAATGALTGGLLVLGVLSSGGAGAVGSIVLIAVGLTLFMGAVGLVSGIVAFPAVFLGTLVGFLLDGGLVKMNQDPLATFVETHNAELAKKAGVDVSALPGNYFPESRKTEPMPPTSN